MWSAILSLSATNSPIIRIDYINAPNERLYSGPFSFIVRNKLRIEQSKHCVAWEIDVWVMQEAKDVNHLHMMANGSSSTTTTINKTIVERSIPIRDIVNYLLLLFIYILISNLRTFFVLPLDEIWIKNLCSVINKLFSLGYQVTICAFELIPLISLRKRCVSIRNKEGATTSLTYWTISEPKVKVMRKKQ